MKFAGTRVRPVPTWTRQSPRFCQHGTLRNMNEAGIVPRALALQRGRRLEYLTVAWNVVEGLVAVTAGVVAGSISLVGFGLDSFIEVTSGSVLLWRISVDVHEEKRERNEARALKAVGLCFLILAVYVAYESSLDL